MNVSRLFRTALLSVLAFVLVGGIMTAQAQDIFVDAADGNDNNSGQSESSEFATIQRAFDEAANGDVIEIDGGTFYNETATLTKEVQIEVADAEVRVDGLILDAGANTADGTRAALNDADEGVSDADLEVATTLEVVSGFYSLTDGGSDLEVEDGATIEWSADEPSNARFKDEPDASGPGAEPLALDSGNYDLLLSTTDNYTVNSSQLPSGSLNNLTVSGAATLPTDVTDINGDLAVNSGATLGLDANTNLDGDATVDGTIDTGNDLVINSGSQVLSGSGTYGDLDVANTAETGSALTVLGEIDLGATFDLTTGGGVTLNGSGTILTFTGGSFSTDSDNQVTVTGSSPQTIDINAADRNSNELDHLIVNKTGVDPLSIDGADSDNEKLVIASNFGLEGGRVELDNANGSDEDLELGGAAEIAGAILLAESGGSSNLILNQSSDTDISGNGQISVPATASTSNTVTFTELNSVSDFELSGSGTVQFDQQVEVAGPVDISAGGTITFGAGTASSSTGNLTIDGGAGTVDVNGSATLGDIRLDNGTVNFKGSTTVGTVDFNFDSGTDSDLGGDATVNFTGGPNTLASLDLDISAQGDADPRALVDVGGETTINSDVTIAASDEDGGNDEGFAELDLASAGGSVTTVINGGVTIQDGGGTTESDARLLADAADHSLEVTGGISFDGAGVSTEELDVGSDVTLTLGSGDIGISQTGVTFNADASLSLSGSSQQKLTYADGGDEIEALTVDNSEAEDTDAVQLRSDGAKLTVTTLNLLDGRLDDDGTNSADGISIKDNGVSPPTSAIVREAGSIVGDDAGDFAVAGGEHSLTYQNSSGIDAGPEYSGSIGDLAFQGSGSVTLTSGETIGGTLTIASGATVASDGNDITVSDLGGDGTLATVNGSFNGSGTLVLNNGTADQVNAVEGSGTISTLEPSLAGNSSSRIDLALSPNATLDSLVTSGGGTGKVRVVKDSLGTIGGASISGGENIQLRQTLVVDGDFSHDGGTIVLGSGDIDLQVKGANSTINGSGAGYTFNGVGYVVFNGTSAQTLNIPSDIQITRFELDNSNGLTLGGSFTLITDDLLLTDGTLDGGSNLKANVSGDGRIVVESGTFSGTFQSGQNASRVVYENSSDLTAGEELSATVNEVILQGSGQVTLDNAVTVTDALNLANGTLAAGENLTIDDTESNGVRVTRGDGSLTGNPTFATAYAVRYNPSADVTVGAEISDVELSGENFSSNVAGLSVDASGQTVSLDGNASTFDADIKNGALDMGSDSLTVTENASINGSLEASGDGALVLDGGDNSSNVQGSYTSLPTVVAEKDRDSNNDFQTATVDRTNATGGGADITVNGNLVVESGNLTLGSANVGDGSGPAVSVTGDLDVASGARQFDSNISNDLAIAGDFTVEPAALDDAETEAGVDRLDGGLNVTLNGSNAQTVVTAAAGGDDVFNDLTVDNSSGVTLDDNATASSSLVLNNGIVTTGDATLTLKGLSAGDLDRGSGAVDGIFRRRIGEESSEAGSFSFPLSVDGSLQEATIVTDGSTLSNDATVTVTTQGSELAGDQGLPFTAGSGDSEVEVNAKAPVGWTVSFDPDAGTPAAGEAPDFRFRAQGLEGIGDVNQLRVISRAGEGETGNPFSVAGTHEDALFSGGIPLAVSSGVGGFDISNTQQFTFGSDSAVNDFADADQPAGQVAISGSVNYPTVENGELVDGRALEGVEVEATSGDVTATATTDADGNFTIDGLDSGDYEVTANVDRDVSNVSIGDAQRTVSGFAGTEPFAGTFQEEVADVNANGTANATDALRIAFFDLGSVTSFEAGSFLVDTTEVTLGSESESGVSIRVAEFGDANLSGGSSDSGGDASLATTTVSPKSSAQTAAKSATESAGDANRVAAGETFEVPVRVDRGAEVGSYSLSLEYDTKKATFEGISSGRDDIITNGSKEDGTLQVGWFDRSGESTLELTGGSELVTLRFSAAEGVEGAEFAPEITSGEINGPGAKAVAAGVETQAVRIAKPAPDEFALNGSYPNPASQQATVEMDLPVRAQVTVEVYNTLGQRVQTVEQSMSAGAGQTVQLDASQLASGQYFYRVKASLDGNQTRETGRLTIVK